MDELVCPYCGATQMDAEELCPYEGKLECNSCGEEFHASIQPTISFHSSKIDTDKDENSETDREQALENLQEQGKKLPDKPVKEIKKDIRKKMENELNTEKDDDRRKDNG